MNIQEKLFEFKDEKYASFCADLTPNINPKVFIGVRVPQLRTIANSLNQEEIETFLKKEKHYYYEENLLHAILLTKIANFECAIKYIELFLPYIDNWAVCDILKPKSFKNSHKKLMPYIEKWIISNKEYTVRFAILTLMNEFLDEDFKTKYLEKVSNIRSDKYYVNMMIAWYFATALAKHYDETIVYLQQNKLDKFCHKKTIQKAIESYRITDQQKEYLKTLRKRNTY